MNNDHSLNPLVGRSLLLPVTASHYLHNMALIHVFFMQYHQEQPMDINICSFSIAPCIWCHLDMIVLLSTWSLPFPYDSLTMAKFLSGQAQVLVLYLWLPSLWSKHYVMPMIHNALPDSPCHHLRKCSGLVWVCSRYVHVFFGHKHMVPCGDNCVWTGLIRDLPDTSSHFLVCRISQKGFCLCEHISNRILA